MTHTMTQDLTVQQIDPRTLLVDVNVRADAKVTPELVASIKAHGVLVPIVAVQAEQGVRVRYGHRRTLGAIQADLATVPVIVVGQDSGDDAAQVERILRQYDENEQRAGLTNVEKVQAVEQLAAFGVSPAQIAKKMRTKRAQVDNALAVAGSALAKGAADRYEFLTLDQAAVLAEFEDDTETVTALVAAAQTGRFEHAAQRARDDRAEAAERRQITDALQAEGLTVVDRPAYNSTTLPLGRLVDVDEATHRDCPGHVVWLATDWTWVDTEGNEVGEDAELSDEDAGALTQRQVFVTERGCAEFAQHGHNDRYARGHDTVATEDKTPEQREAEKAARRLVIENNKAADSAQVVRREWVQQVLTRKTPPTGVAEFIAAALTRDASIIQDAGANHLAARWFGIDASGYGCYSGPLADLAEAATAKRAQVIALGVVLAGYEAQMDRSTWRRDGTGAPHGRYLRFLASQGYTLAEVEEYAISDKTT